MDDSSDDGVIRAQRFELTDSTGKPRMMLWLNNDEPFLDFIDRDGFPRISIRLHEQSPSIAFMSQEGHPWFSIGEDKTRETYSMVFFNPNNIPAFWAEMPANAPALLVLYDADGKEMWRAPGK